MLFSLTLILLKGQMTPVYIHEFDAITFSHVRSVLSSHGLGAGVAFGGSYVCNISASPEVAQSLLAKEAPASYFSIYIPGKRNYTPDFSEDRWFQLSGDQLLGKVKPPFGLDQILLKGQLKVSDCKLVKYIPRSYQDRDSLYAVGFEVLISTTTGQRRFQILSDSGKSLVVEHKYLTDAQRKALGLPSNYEMLPPDKPTTIIVGGGMR